MEGLKAAVRVSLKHAKLEFYNGSYVFCVLFIYKDERQKLDIPEMTGVG